MAEVYLAYMEMQEQGNAPCEVSFYACLCPMKFPAHSNVKIMLKHSIVTEETPKQIVEKLEEMVFREVGERPSNCDILDIVGQDNPKYKSYRRQTVYHMTAGIPKNGETQAQAIERATKNALERNQKIYEIYQILLQEYSTRTWNEPKDPSDIKEKD